jgi:SWI/SNF-related matrix-associated actin-dependent regulator of chromatin subfamily A member 5
MERLKQKGFPDWSRRDFQQLVKALESHGWYELFLLCNCARALRISVSVHRPDGDYSAIAAEITDKSEEEVEEYFAVFAKKWKTLAGMNLHLPADELSSFSQSSLAEYPRIQVRITEGEAKRNKRNLLEGLLQNKIRSVTFPMQELELNYPTTKGKVYSEEEDRYLLCRLNYHGMDQENVYDLIKRDISEFPVFRFDWFFKSRSPQELQRRCNTLLGMLEKEAETEEKQKKEDTAVKAKASSSARSKVRPYSGLHIT